MCLVKEKNGKEVDEAGTDGVGGRPSTVRKATGRGLWGGRTLQATLKSFTLGELRVTSGSYLEEVIGYVHRLTLTAELREHRRSNGARTGTQLGATVITYEWSDSSLRARRRGHRAVWGCRPRAQSWKCFLEMPVGRPRGGGLQMESGARERTAVGYKFGAHSE